MQRESEAAARIHVAPASTWDKWQADMERTYPARTGECFPSTLENRSSLLGLLHETIVRLVALEGEKVLAASTHYQAALANQLAKALEFIFDLSSLGIGLAHALDLANQLEQVSYKTERQTLVDRACQMMMRRLDVVAAHHFGEDDRIALIAKWVAGTVITADHAPNAIPKGGLDASKIVDDKSSTHFNVKVGGLVQRIGVEMPCRLHWQGCIRARLRILSYD
jgi:hypothetical protein